MIISFIMEGGREVRSSLGSPEQGELGIEQLLVLMGRLRPRRVTEPARALSLMAKTHQAGAITVLSVTSAIQMGRQTVVAKSPSGQLSDAIVIEVSLVRAIAVIRSPSVR